MNLADNDFLFITVIGILILILMVVFFVLFVMQYRRRQLEFQSEKMSLEKEYNEELLRTQLELSERVLQNISEEIHDNIGQSLTVAKLQLHDINAENFLDRCQSAKDLITRSLKDLRNLSRTLNGEYILREGLVKSLASEVELINSGGAIRCTLRGEIPFNCLDPHSEIILFRCTQEALSNALRHSGADQIDVSITMEGTLLKVSVVDNGNGLPPENEIRKGLGMENMKKRIALLRGEFVLKSAPNMGTTVEIVLPC